MCAWHRDAVDLLLPTFLLKGNRVFDKVFIIFSALPPSGEKRKAETQPPVKWSKHLAILKQQELGPALNQSATSDSILRNHPPFSQEQGGGCSQEREMTTNSIMTFL